MTTTTQDKLARVLGNQEFDNQSPYDWASNSWRAPDTWSLNPDAFYYRPSVQVTQTIESFLQQPIPGLAPGDYEGAGFSYKDFIRRAQELYPGTEVLIVGGATRDIIDHIGNDRPLAQALSDIDIQVTLTQEQTVTVIKDILNIELSRRIARGVPLESLLNDYLITKPNGYVGFGDTGKGENLDIFNAAIFALGDRSTNDFTVNSNYYRYSETDPFIFSQNQTAISDTIEHQIRLTQNWFDGSDFLIEKPAQIWRYIYFIQGKGYQDADPSGMTLYSILRALHTSVEAIEQTGQYQDYIDLMSFSSESLDGSVSTTKDIAVATKKFMRKKFADVKKAVELLDYCKVLYDGEHSALPGTFGRDILALSGIIDKVIVQLDPKFNVLSNPSDLGVLTQEHSDLIARYQQVKANLPVATVDNHQGHIGELYDLMFELKASLMPLEGENRYPAFKAALDSIVANEGQGFSAEAGGGIDRIKTLILQYSQDSELNAKLDTQLEKLRLILQGAALSNDNTLNSISLADIAISPSLKAELVGAGLLDTDEQRNLVRNLSHYALSQGQEYKTVFNRRFVQLIRAIDDVEGSGLVADDYRLVYATDSQEAAADFYAIFKKDQQGDLSLYALKTTDWIKVTDSESFAAGRPNEELLTYARELRARLRQAVVEFGDVSLSSGTVAAEHLYDFGVLLDGSPVTADLLAELGQNIDLAAITLDPEFFTRALSEIPENIVLQQLQQLVQQTLELKSEDELFATALGDSRTKKYLQSMLDAGADELDTKLAQTVVETLGKDAGDRAQLFSLMSDVDDSQKADIQRLYTMAKEYSGFNREKYLALQLAHPEAGHGELLQQMALDSAEQRIQPDHNQQEIAHAAKWSASEARQYLVEQGLIVFDEGKPRVSSGDFNHFLENCDGIERIKVSTALMNLSPETYTQICSQLELDNEEYVRVNRLIGNADSERAKKAITLKGASNKFGTALSVFQTLNSVRQLISSWDDMDNTNRGLTVTQVVGGVAMTPISAAVSKALTSAGKALGAIGQFSKAASVVEAGALDLALAPITFASLGLQWQSFNKLNGDTHSYEYKSLVANTVLTTVTTAASLALTSISIAASLSSAVAASVLGTIAASAGPIGVAIAAASFIINGVVQGALQLDEYGDYFANTGDKVEQFFAAWIGVETGAMKLAREIKQKEEALETSLNQGWEQTKQYLADIFAKDGFSTMEFRDREIGLRHQIFDGNKFVFQKKVDYDEQMSNITFDHATAEGKVWTELGGSQEDQVAGESGIRNMFNLDGCLLNRLTGGNQPDVFNLNPTSELKHIDAGGGQNTLMLEAGELDVSLNPSGDTGMVLRYHGDHKILQDLRTFEQAHETGVPLTRAVNQSVQLANIQTFVIRNSDQADIRGSDLDQFFDVSGTSVTIRGGAGRNTYSLNEGNKVISCSHDTLLWNGLVSAEVELAGVPGEINHTLLLSLSDHYSTLSLSKRNNNLQLHSKGNTLTLKGLYQPDKGVDTTKIVQFADPFGYSFSLPGLAYVGAQTQPLTRIAKTFVLGAAATAEQRMLNNDMAANTYSLQQGAGAFVAQLNTQQLMQFVLDAPLSSLIYRIIDNTLIITSTREAYPLELWVRNYRQVQEQGLLHIWLNDIDGSGKTMNPVLLPPWSGAVSGNLAVKAAAPEVASHIETFAQASHLSSVEWLDLQSATASYFIEAGELLQAQGEVYLFLPEDAETDKLIQARLINDLYLYYQDNFDNQRGIHFTPSLRIKHFFAQEEHAKLYLQHGANEVDRRLPLSLNYDQRSNGQDLIASSSAEVLLGGEGLDTYRIAPFAGEQGSWTIDNSANDELMDKLEFSEDIGLQQLLLGRQGDDLTIKVFQPGADFSGRAETELPAHKQIKIRNYMISHTAEHLALVLDQLMFKLPRLDSISGYFIYEPDQDIAVLAQGDFVTRVSKFSKNLTSLKNVYLTGAFDDYEISAFNYDLTLSAAHRKLVVRDYYHNPKALTFHFSGGSGGLQIPEVLIPDGFDTTPYADLPAEYWLPCANTGTDTREEVTNIRYFDGTLTTSELRELPADTFSVYIELEPYYVNLDRVNLITTYREGSQSYFELYLSRDGYLHYTGYRPEYGGVEFGRINSFEFPKPLSAMVLTFKKDGNDWLLGHAYWDGDQVVHTYPRVEYLDSRYCLRHTYVAGARFNHSDVIAKARVLPAEASDAQIRQISETQGASWEALELSAKAYLRMYGIPEGLALEAAASIDNKEAVRQLVYAYHHTQGCLSNEFYLYYIAQEDDWLFASGATDYAKQLEQMDRTPEFIETSYKYGLSLEEVAAYEDLEPQLDSHMRLADFALALKGSDSEFIRVRVRPVESLSGEYASLTDALFDELHIEEWRKPGYIIAITSHCSNEDFDELKRKLARNYLTHGDRMLALKSWLVYALSGAHYDKRHFIPGSNTAKFDDDLKIIKAALVHKGYLEAGAEDLAYKMLDARTLDYRTLSDLLQAGVSDNVILSGLVRAGVSANDIRLSNANRTRYHSGDRTDLIQVSVSDALHDMPSGTEAVYYTSGYHDLHAGAVIDGDGASPNPAEADYDSDSDVVKFWEQGHAKRSIEYSLPQPKSYLRCIPGNMVDGSDFIGEAACWRGINRTDSDGNIRNINLDLEDVFIRFDFKHKLALTKLTLRLDRQVADNDQHEPFGDSQYCVQVLTPAGEWQVKSTANMVWVPGSETLTVDIDTSDIPYSSYRLKGVSGLYDRDSWIVEVEFDTSTAGQANAGTPQQSVADVLIRDPGFEQDRGSVTSGFSHWEKMGSIDSAYVREEDDGAQSNKFAYIGAGETFVYQELDETYDPRTRYALSADVRGGSEAGAQAHGDIEAVLSLWAGYDTELAKRDEPVKLSSADDWQTIRLEIPAGINEDMAGENLIILVRNMDSTDEVHLDNVKLIKLTEA
ncbi:hypothetical protein SG34_031680 [Thalassomonas viridans]|uniref:Uncharacterized protein n=1 Tax=Thalassomonas viridans TaxID=137584 RepID=A0AAE9Z824_9GAMM|nr:hypothetical protein [Thalassomonas viridans]WDE08485.1 hypothetical protein SG34_031680 [Thalassomonas viridans]